jgi:type I restriction enzyme R subunit
LFESAVVISPPDTREGNTEVDESKLPEVTKWWKDNVGTQDESVYTRNIISRFDTDDKLKLLIVVDKLLTGFDEPKRIPCCISTSRLSPTTLSRRLPG